MICNQCRPRLSTCPICRIPITENNQMRLYFAERLIEDKVPNQCKFADLGCDVELIGQLLLRHEASECPFEPLNCDFKGCKEKIARSKKTDHLTMCDYRLCECPISDCKSQVIHKNLINHIKEVHFGMDHTQYRIHIFLVSLAINFVILIIMYFLFL